MMLRTPDFASLRRFLATLLAVLVCCCSVVQTAMASTQQAPNAQYALDLKQLIGTPKLRLQGVDTRSGMVFAERQDEEITQLTLDLALTQSPALIDQLSHVNVLLNNHYVATVALNSQSAAEVLNTKIPLPVSDIEPFNVLELQLIGHYTLDCEDPRHKDLWIQIEPSSRLVFDVTRRQLPNQLGLLPAPFFDARDTRTQPLSFVLGTPSNTRLEAAGIVASWLGALATYRGTDFQVAAHGIPAQGHAIVVLAANEQLPGLSLPKAQGPTVAMRSNPNDPAGKVLIITGRDDDEIRQAAVALALGGQTLSGAEALLKPVLAPVRKPYDAPNWIATDRPTYLGELLPTTAMTVAGFEVPAITVPLRLPPDLSSWKTADVPLHLRYQYTTLSDTEDSTLSVLINNQFIDSVKLGEGQAGLLGELTKTVGVSEQTFLLPVALFESQAQLSLQFNYPPPIRQECSGGYLDPRFSSIDPQSSIDFSGLPHHMAMPDLAAFRNAAFPFSRLADLSETVVLLSNSAGPAEYSAFLNVLGKVGQATAYPATALRVQRQATGLEDKDILIIEGGSTSEILQQWAAHLPKPQLSRQERPWLERVTQFFSTAQSQPILAFAIPGNGIYAAGFESPLSAGRSVVVIGSRHADNLPAGTQTLLFDAEVAAQVQGSLVTVQDDQVTALSTDKTYYVGQLGHFQQTLWYLSKHPWMLLLIFLISAVLLAIVLYLSLRARAQNRLMIGNATTTSSKHKE